MYDLSRATVKERREIPYLNIASKVNKDEQTAAGGGVSGGDHQSLGWRRLQKPNIRYSVYCLCCWMCCFAMCMYS